MWKAFVEAGKTSNAHDPKLSEYASGEALKTITSALAKNHDAHEVTKGHVTNHPVVTAVKPAASPTEVDIRDCANDSAWLKYRESGKPVNHQPGGNHLITAVVKNVGGWKVTAFAARGVGTCS